MRFPIGTLLLLLLLLAFYLAGQATNPPGFFTDESSIAYNALTIARNGVDQYGNRFPLYFTAFGEHKNPVYVYTLAAAFKVLTPADLVARRLSALAGFAAALLMGALGWRMTRSRRVAMLTLLAAICTPMLFQISRLAFEVAFFPLVTAALLWSVYEASRRERLTWRDAAAIGLSLVLMAYTYSIGRLLAPLLLVTIAVVFFSRKRAIALAGIAAAFIVLAAIPMARYNRAQGGALTARFQEVSYVPALRAQPAALAMKFTKHYVMDFMAFRGDPIPRHHVPGSGGSILLATFILAAAGAAIALRRRRDRHGIFIRLRLDRYTTFVLIGTFFSVVPAALTNELLHTLRLAPFPLFLIALSIPALEHLPKRWLTPVVIAGALQAMWFFHVFHRDGASRGPYFDAGIREVVRDSAATGKRPIALDASIFTKAHVLWYGARNNLGPSQIVETETPAPGSIVITDRYVPSGAQMVSVHGGYGAYIAP